MNLLKFYSFAFLCAAFQPVEAGEPGNLSSHEKNIEACIREERGVRLMSQATAGNVFSTSRVPVDNRSDQEIEAGCVKEINRQEANAREAEVKQNMQRLQEAKKRVLAETQQLMQASAYEEHALKIRNKELPVVTFNDAVIFYEAQKGLPIVLQPPIFEDNLNYFVRGVVENYDGEVLVFNAGSGGGPIYFFAKIDGEVQYIDNFKPRVNSVASVVGEFVGLRSYDTVLGQSKVAPVFKIVVFGR